MTSIQCAHTLYNNRNMNKKAHFQYAQSYMCSYPIQQQKHKHKRLFQKLPFLHVYIPYTTTQT